MVVVDQPAASTQSIGSRSSCTEASTRSVPPRCAACGATAAVHSDPPLSASAIGLLPVVIFSIKLGPSGSTRATVPPSPPATHTFPPPAATAVGSPPISSMPDTTFLAGSIRDSVPSWRLATHTAPSPTASALGPLPTAITRTTAPLRGSMRVTVARLLAGDPERAGAGHDRGRDRADRDLGCGGCCRGRSGSRIRRPPRPPRGRPR